MHGDHERHAVIQLREDAAEMAVPSVAMHDVGVDVRGVEIESNAGPRRRPNASGFGQVNVRRVDFETAHRQIPLPHDSCSPKQRTSTRINFASSRER